MGGGIATLEQGSERKGCNQRWREGWDVQGGIAALEQQMAAKEVAERLAKASNTLQHLI